MSLINQMLRDLAQRQPKDELDSALLSAQSYAVLTQRPSHSLLLYTLVPASLAFILYIALQQSTILSSATEPSRIQPTHPVTHDIPQASSSAQATAATKSAMNVNAVDRLPEQSVAAPSVAKEETKPVIVSNLSTPIATPTAAKPQLVAKQVVPIVPKSVSSKSEPNQQTANKMPAIAAHIPTDDEIMQDSLALIRSGQLYKASALLQNHIKGETSSTAILNLYSRVLIEQGDHKAATAQLKRHQSSGQFDLESKSMLAALLQKASDHRGAATLYQEIVSENPRSGIAWLGLGISLEAIGDARQSYTAYQQALQQTDIESHLREFLMSRMQHLQQTGLDYDHNR